MIKINPQIIKPKDTRPTAEIFPNLYEKINIYPFYKQVKNIYCYFDKNFDLVCETTINDSNELLEKLKTYLFDFIKNLDVSINYYNNRLKYLKEFYTPEHQKSKAIKTSLKYIKNFINIFKREKQEIQNILKD